MSKTLGKYNKLYCKQPTYDGEVCVVRHVFGDSVAEEVGLVDQLDGTGQDGPHLVLNTLIKRKHRVSKKLYIHTFKSWISRGLFIMLNVVSDIGTHCKFLPYLVLSFP